MKILAEVLKPLEGESLEEAYRRQAPVHAEPDHAAYAATLDKVVNGVNGISRWSRLPGLAFLSSAVLIGEQISAPILRQSRFAPHAKSAYRVCCWHHVAYLVGLREALGPAAKHDPLMDHARSCLPRFAAATWDGPRMSFSQFSELMSTRGFADDELREIGASCLVSLSPDGAAAYDVTRQLGSYFDKRAMQVFLKAKMRGGIGTDAYGFACSLSAFRQLALHDVPAAMRGEDLTERLLPEFEYPPVLGVNRDLN